MHVPMHQTILGSQTPNKLDVAAAAAVFLTSYQSSCYAMAKTWATYVQY